MIMTSSPQRNRGAARVEGNNAYRVRATQPQVRYRPWTPRFASVTIDPGPTAVTIIGDTRQFTAGSLVVNLDAQEASVAGQPVALTRTEFALLRALAENEGCVLSKETLLSHVWGYSYVGDTRVIPVHMSNLRRKLEKAGGGGYLHTVRGTGYRLQPPAHSPTRISVGNLPVFVGRADQLTTVERSYRRAFSGAGGCTLLVWGEAGIGKTRLAEELVSRATEGQACALWGRCLPDEGTPPFWPWTQILRQWISTQDEAAIARILDPHLEHIGPLIPGWRSPGLHRLAAAHADMQARFGMFDSVASFLRAASADRPLIIILDDLQDADTSSAHLLEFLSHELRSMRLLLIATCRDIDLDADHQLSRALASLAHEGCDSHLALSGLNRDEVAALMADIDGNPFLVIQTTRLLLEEGNLDRSDGTAELVRIPQGVHVTLLRRLENLSADCRYVLSVGSVVGRQFTLATVARVTGLHAEALIRALDGAVTARFVQALPGDHTFRFQHNLTREAIYADLGAARRMQLHAEVGAALEAVYSAHLDDRLDEIAHHYRKAAPIGWIAKAVAYSLRAGQAALSRYAWEDARQHFEACLQIVAGLPDGDTAWTGAEIEAWEALGDVAMATQRHDRAHAAYEQALVRLPSHERVQRSRLRRKSARTRLDRREIAGAWEL
jgi:predicted ATPase/DNA-binding winged helix-turn-helix (wHTH) protein